MKYPAFVLFVVIGSSTVASESQPLPRQEKVAVVVGFRDSWSEATVDEMKREVETVLHVDGMGLEWHHLSEPSSRQVFDRVVVVRFSGECHSHMPDPAAPAASALGFTHISDGAILPFAEVDCGRVRRLVRDLLPPGGGSRSDAMLGRSLGRVLAHELYHILADTQKHGRNGIAKPVLTPRELTAAELLFDESELDSIRDRVVRPHIVERAAAGGQ